MAIKISGTDSKIIFLAGTANTTTLTSSLTATPWTMTLPPTAGTAGQVLTTDGTGVLSWSNGGGGGGGVPAAPVNSVQFNNAGAFGGSANLTWDNTNTRLGIGNSAPAHTLDVTGDAYAVHVAASQGIFLNADTITANFTIPAGYNGLSAGPVNTIAGVTVTVTPGQTWKIV